MLLSPLPLNMYKFTLTAGLCLIIAGLASSTRLVCYFNSLAENREEDGKVTVFDIDPNICTHLIYAFADINDQNELVASSATDIQRYQSFNGLKAKNPSLKTLLAVGGLTFDKNKFRTMVSTLANRTKFIQSAITLLRGNGFDGINLDWRFPGGDGSQPEDKLGFTVLCEELKDAFEAEGQAMNRDRLIVTASVSAERDTIDASYEISKIAMHLDFINVLTFDFHGPWESVTGHHSPLYRGATDTGDNIYSNTDSAMMYWRDQGTPAQKLNLGLAAYGRAFTLSSATNNVGAPASGPGEDGCYTGVEGFWASYETCLYLEDVTIKMIPDQKVPYAITEDQWVGFDNKDSLNAKVNYLIANNFGGVFVWSLDLDDFHGQFCKQGNYSFLSHLHSLLTPDFSSPTITTTVPTNTNHSTTKTSPTTTSTTPTTTTTTSPTTTSTISTTTTTTSPTTTSTTPTTTTTTSPTTTSTTSTTTTTTSPTTTTTSTTTTTTKKSPCNRDSTNSQGNNNCGNGNQNNNQNGNQNSNQNYNPNNDPTTTPTTTTTTSPTTTSTTPTTTTTTSPTTTSTTPTTTSTTTTTTKKSPCNRDSTNSQGNSNCGNGNQNNNQNGNQNSNQNNNSNNNKKQ